MTGFYKLVIVAGPNGAGKTTFVRQWFPTAQGLFEFVNADEIARSLAGRGLSSSQLDLLAGREMLRRIQDHVANRRDVVLETTLSGRSLAGRIEGWRKLSYKAILYYLRLATADQAIDRVARRVAAGGHSVPEPVIRRRFRRGLANLDRLYKPAVDEWHVYDSLEGRFEHAQSWSRS